MQEEAVMLALEAAVAGAAAAASVLMAIPCRQLTTLVWLVETALTAESVAPAVPEEPAETVVPGRLDLRGEPAVRSILLLVVQSQFTVPSC